MAHCLLVDDDAEIRESLKAYLQGFGWQVSTARDGAEMRARLVAGPVDVVVLDQMLPGEDGLTLLRWLQLRRYASPPVLMLTAIGDTASRVVGLELGADDYMAKPFEPRELVARLTAVVRRGSKRASSEDPPSVQRFAGWRFDRLTRQLVSPHGVAIALSAAEYRLLVAFVEHPRRVLGRNLLIELTRAPGVDVNDRSIDIAVSRLRAKLGDTAREPQLLRTVRGEGYLFDAEVRA